MKVAIYSSDRHSSNKDIDNQILQLRQLAREQGWTVHRVYREPPAQIHAVPGNARSNGKAKSNGYHLNGNGNGKHNHATPADRAALPQMLKDAETRKFDVLLFWSLDRISSKGTLGTMTFLQQLSTWGIRYRSHQDKYLDTCGRNREAVDGLLAALLRQERVQISQRTRDGLLHQKISGKPGPNGRFGPGKPPVGFDKPKARKLRAQEKSYREIAKACKVSKATIYRFFNPPEKVA